MRTLASAIFAFPTQVRRGTWLRRYAVSPDGDASKTVEKKSHDGSRYSRTAIPFLPISASPTIAPDAFLLFIATNKKDKFLSVTLRLERKMVEIFYRSFRSEITKTPPI